MKKFTATEAEMLLNDGRKINQVFSKEQTNLEDLVHYILRVCNQNRNRVRLRVRGWYDTVGFDLEIFFPLEADDDVQIVFDSDIHLDVNESTGQFFYAGKWYEIGFISAQLKNRNTAGFGSDLYKDKEPVEAAEDKEDVRSYNVGASDYAQHKIQPWDIWREYNLNPWDADIVKRVLRTKETDGRRLDYEKIIHICKERIRQIDEYGK